MLLKLLTVQSVAVPLLIFMILFGLLKMLPLPWLLIGRSASGCPLEDEPRVLEAAADQARLLALNSQDPSLKICS